MGTAECGGPSLRRRPGAKDIGRPPRGGREPAHVRELMLLVPDPNAHTKCNLARPHPCAHHPPYTPTTRWFSSVATQSMTTSPPDVAPFAALPAAFAAPGQEPEILSPLHADGALIWRCHLAGWGVRVVQSERY